MKVAIIGNGISGITAARYLRKISDCEITVISAESDHFFSRTALMYIYMGHMRYEDTKPYEDWFWEKNRINLIRDFVQKVDFDAKCLQLKAGGEHHYDKLILATGSASNKFGWPGQDLPGVQGLYTLQDLQSMEQASDQIKRAVVVGGGLIGIEMVEMFMSRNIPVSFLVREQSFWDMVLPSEESQMINRHIREHHVDLHLSEEIVEILGGSDGRCRAVTTKSGKEIACEFVGLTVGVHPNINFLRDTALEVQKGILVNDYLETNLPDVYAIGDCAQLRNPQAGRRPIEAIWYTGRQMGKTVAANICGKSVEYKPRLWFNSAKFFDIEYQIYGQVSAKLIDGHKSIYWEADDGKKAIRINYNQQSKAVVGFHLMGIRYRHEVCEKWILDKTHIEEVLSNLALANFDPEFYKTYQHEIVGRYNQLSGASLQVKRSRLADVLSFLGRA